MNKHLILSLLGSVGRVSPFNLVGRVGLVGLMGLVSVGCTTNSEMRVQPADIASKTDVIQRGQIHTERAAEYFRLGSMAVALEAAEQATTVAPKYAPGYNMLGLIYMELRDDTKAQTAFAQAIALAPNDSDVLNNYGWFQCQRQSALRALPLFDRALLNPLYRTPEKALYNAGVCARKAGDDARAEVKLRAALQRAPSMASALFEIADIEFAQGRLREAELSIARYLQSVQQASADGLFLAAKIARASGDRGAESNYIIQLRRRFPDSPQTQAISNPR